MRLSKTKEKLSTINHQPLTNRLSLSLSNRLRLAALVTLSVVAILLTSIVLFIPSFAEASTVSTDSDFEVTVREMLELSLTNCDATNSSVVVVNVVPSTEGTFKSACQTVVVNTNAPGYTLTAKAEGSSPNYNSGTITNNLLYQNPTSLQDPNFPIILSTSNPITTPAALINDTWGFAVENRLNFPTGYEENNASNIYAQLPTQDTTIYQTTTFPLPQINHKFYYATRLTPTTIAGTYMTTVTYTAIGEIVQPSPLKFRQVSAGLGHACAITSAGDAYCWGDNGSGQLGNGTEDDSLTPVPVSKLSGGLEGLTIKQIETGDSFTCAVASDDNAYCWGANWFGMLGNGTGSDSNIPVPVSKLTGGLEGLTIKQISANGYHACVVASDDNVYCWGFSDGLGNGTDSNSNIPVPVSKLAGGLEGLTIKQISAGFYTHTCAIASDDNAYCWGDNYSGALGNSTNSNSNIPVPVSRLSGGLAGLTIKQISVGSTRTCAVASDDNAYCWGGGSDGGLGNSTNSNSNIPVPVSKLTGGLIGQTIKQVAAGDDNVCVIASDNNAYCWGNNQYGQLGNGFNTNSNIPVPVSRLSGGLADLSIKQISAGDDIACTIASNGNIYCWGENKYGQLGNGEKINSNIPVKVINPIP